MARKRSVVLTTPWVEVVSEKGFQGTVRELAETVGWTVFFTWNSMHSGGVEYTIDATGEIVKGGGEPDLRMVLSPVARVWRNPISQEVHTRVTPGRYIVAELKKHNGKLTNPQALALTLLRDAGVEAHAWWPEDWDDIVRILSGY